METTIKTALVVDAFTRKVLLWLETGENGTTINDDNSSIPLQPGDDPAAIARQWVLDTDPGGPVFYMS